MASVERLVGESGRRQRLAFRGCSKQAVERHTPGTETPGRHSHRMSAAQPTGRTRRPADPPGPEPRRQRYVTASNDGRNSPPAMRRSLIPSRMIRINRPCSHGARTRARLPRVRSISSTLAGAGQPRPRHAAVADWRQNVAYLPQRNPSRWEAMSCRRTAVTCWYRFAIEPCDQPMTSIAARSGTPSNRTTVAAV